MIKKKFITAAAKMAQAHDTEKKRLSIQDTQERLAKEKEYNKKVKAIRETEAKQANIRDTVVWPLMQCLKEIHHAGKPCFEVAAFTKVGHIPQLYKFLSDSPDATFKTTQKKYVINTGNTDYSGTMSIHISGKGRLHYACNDADSIEVTPAELVKKVAWFAAQYAPKEVAALSKMEKTTPKKKTAPKITGKSR